MSSGNAGGSGLSLLLVTLMILPGILTIASSGDETTELREDRSSNESIEVPVYSGFDLGSDFEDPSHGWYWDKENTGRASLFHRTASYVPIHDWSHRTGEEAVTGWHALGHDYPIPSDWKIQLEEMGMECNTFFAPQGLHCNVPKLTPGTLKEAGVIGAFRLAKSDKIAPDVIPILQGLGNDFAEKEGRGYVMLVALSGTGHFGDILETGLEVRNFRHGKYVDVIANEKEIAMLSVQNYVEWMEPKYSSSFDNEGAAEITGVEWVSDSGNMGSGGALTGDGVIVGVMDSGLTRP